jgi:hypothetical protein
VRGEDEQGPDRSGGQDAEGPDPSFLPCTLTGTCSYCCCCSAAEQQSCEIIF